MKTIYLFLNILILSSISYAQSNVTIQWQKSYGGSGWDGANSVQQTKDGGFIIGGYTTSYDGDITNRHGNLDYWIIKTDPSGAIEWQKTYGGSDSDSACSIQQTTDGGYIIVGITWSRDGEVTGNHGYLDYWAVKTDQFGTIQWQKSYGGTSRDEAQCILQTSDGGFIMAGYASSNNGDVTGNHGSSDYWVVKTDPSGILQWQKCYGGSGNDEAQSIQQTTDGGFIIAGYSNSNNGDVKGNHGSTDYWVVKIDPTGTIEWQKCFGSSNNDDAYNIHQTVDGGFIIAGNSWNYYLIDDGDVTGHNGNSDYWIIKTDHLGAIQWQKCYGGSGWEAVENIQQTMDKGYIIAGSSSSNDFKATGNHGSLDYWIVKTDPFGLIQWQKSFGGSELDEADCISQTTDGSFIIAGYSNSNNGDVTGNHGRQDSWVVKLCSPDPISISNSEPNYCISTTLTATDGFTSYIWSTGETTPVINVTSGGTYKVVATNASGCPSESQIVVSAPIPTQQGDPIVISKPSYCFSTSLIAPTGFADYLWNTGETTQIINTTIGGNYNVISTNLEGCSWKSQVTVTNPVQPYSGEQICMVTIDEQTGKNVIVFEKANNVGIASFQIYRLNNMTSQYQNIGSVGIENTSSFMDNDAVPAQQSYQYKISIKDTCDKESGLSNLHRTILLQANSGINKEVNLFWNPYEGFAYPNFQIFRSENNNPFYLIANVPNNVYTFTDLNPPSTGTKKYQVRVSKQLPCTPTKSSIDYVSSNVIDFVTTGFDENQAGSVSIYPNPATDNVTIKTKTHLSGSKYAITDQTGRTILSGKLESEVTNINISQITSGVYIFRIDEFNNQILKIIKK